MKTKIFLLMLLMLALANTDGGNQRYVDGYLVQISNLPISPFVGEKTAMIISFANTSGDLLNNIEAKIRINQIDKTIFENNFSAAGGAMKFEYTFDRAGLYDFIVEFKSVNESTVHMPDHFLIEVKQAQLLWHVAVIVAVIFLIGVAAGFVFGWRLRI